MEKFHVVIRAKEDNRIVWRFTDKSVSRIEAEKVMEENKEGLNDIDFYLSIEKE